MKLPFLAKKHEEKEFFLTLLLSSGKVGSILFEKTGDKLLILAAHTEEFSEPLDSLPAERLVELGDVVISNVEEQLPSGESLHKTIFAVPYRWITEGRISKDYLVKLKSLCDSLKLTPVGFIISIEAIIAYLHRKEGAPVTAIFVEAGKKHVTCTIVKSGSILSAYEGEIDEDIAKTVDKLLLTQEVTEVLPSKIVLLNFEHAKKTQQSMLAHPWSKSLSFLHLPQVEVLETEVESQAVISGVSQQMGFVNLPDVDLTQLVKKPAPVEVAETKELIQAEEKIADEADTLDENVAEVHPEEAEDVLTANPEEFGFFKDIDVLTKKKEIPETVDTKEEEVEHEIERETMEGIVVAKAVKSDIDMQEMEEPQSRTPKIHVPHVSFKMPNVLGIVSKGKGPFLYPIVAVIILLAAVVAYYYLFEKVEVTVLLNKKEVSKDLTVTFSPDKDTSAEDAVVHIEERDVQVDGSEEKSVTGTKETGDKAKGELTIYNKTEDKKTFSKGTTLVGPNSLQFTLTDDVSVASTSSFSTTFSNAKGKVEASKFGKEYNIPSGTNFSLEGISTSDFFAKNDSAFAGGSKKEIKVVSARDINSLTTKVVDSLSKKAIGDAAGKENASEQVLPLPLSYTFESKTFSKEEGKEADSVSLTASITYSLGFLNKDQVSSLAKELNGKDIPSSYAYSSDDSTLSMEDVAKDEDGVVTGKLKFNSVFLPHIDSSRFVQQLTGKNEKKVAEIVGGEGVSDSEVAFTRSLPFMPKILPFNKNNISVVVKKS